MPVNITIPSLGDKFKDYRQDIPGESFTFGPIINAGQVQYFAFHHSVTKQTAKNDGNWKAECDIIANLHINQGWAGIGYRFVIASDGTVAYVGDLARGGAAVTGNNEKIFSACFIGDFTKELPTAAQVHSGHLLARHFLEQMPQYPSLDSWDEVIGHRDAKELLNLPGATATACPGSSWRVGGDTLRDRIINDRFTDYPNPQPTNTTPSVPPVDPCADIKKDLAKIKQINDVLTKQIDDKDNDLIELNAELGTLKEQVIEFMKTIETLSTQDKQSSKLLKQNEVLTDRVKGYQEAEKTWNRSRAQYEKEVTDLKANSFKAAFTQILTKIGIK